MRFLPIGPRSLLAELADLDKTLALFDALNADPIPGVAEGVNRHQYGLFQLTRTATDIVTMREAHRSALLKSPKALKLLDSLFQQPLVALTRKPLSTFQMALPATIRP